MNLQDSPVSEFKSKRGLRRIANALRYSIEGLRSAWKNEHAFRQEVFVIIPALFAALLLPVTVLEKAVLIASTLFILIVELLNSAIEAIVDRVSLERHPLSKNAKDFGSAAVTIAISMALLIWGVVLFPLVSAALSK
jgi:diacylglycerol kinase (ATP)